MGLRSGEIGAVGVSNAFHPFKQLPVEIRHMIWRKTLQPRIVEMRWKSIPAEVSRHIATERNPDRVAALSGTHGICYYSPAPLPVALLVCRDSRNAVDALYPLCFATATSGPATRFNMSIDILYLDYFFDELWHGSYNKPVFTFLESLSPMEATRLENIALGQILGYPLGPPKEYWTKLGRSIERFTGLVNILTVHDLSSPLSRIACYCEDDMPRLGELLWEVVDAYSLHDGSKIDRCVEFYNDLEFPDEVIQQLCCVVDKSANLIASYEPHRRELGDWLRKTTTPVFGRRQKEKRPSFI
ncbi:hypothetical protein EG329_001299 [Mollisiaceae sp. DMI_Dod_QoI]|nr:hypothetical protein EG329_001299 [Helotiales sp. DMI_Dod_QoI]